MFIQDESPRKTERLRAQQEQFVRAQQEVLNAFKQSIHTPNQQYQQEKQQESTSTDDEAPTHHQTSLQEDVRRELNPLDFLRQQVAEIRTPKPNDLPVCYIPAGAESRSSSSLPSYQTHEKPIPQDHTSNFRERDAHGREMFSPSSDEDLGRVRFVSARIPATGSGVPYLSKDNDTAKLKSILKSGRTGNQYSSSSSDQETGRSRVMEQRDELAKHRMNLGNISQHHPGTVGQGSRVQGEFAHTTPEIGRSLPSQYPFERIANVSPREEFGQASFEKATPPSGRLPRFSPRAQEEFAPVPTDMGGSLPQQYPGERATDSASSRVATDIDQQVMYTQGHTARIPNTSPRAREEFTQRPPGVAQPFTYRMPSQGLPPALGRPSEGIVNLSNAKPSSRLPSEMLGNSKPSTRLPSDLVSHSSTSCDSESSLEDGVLINGDRIPRPFTAIANCPLYEYSSRLDIQTPTPLQRHMWPALLRGRDVAGVAPKTAGRKMAYLLPIVDQVLDPAAYSELPLTNGVSMMLP